LHNDTGTPPAIGPGSTLGEVATGLGRMILAGKILEPVKIRKASNR
jgi:hypothetical protein